MSTQHDSGIPGWPGSIADLAINLDSPAHAIADVAVHAAQYDQVLKLTGQSLPGKTFNAIRKTPSTALNAAKGVLRGFNPNRGYRQIWDFKTNRPISKPTIWRKLLGPINKGQPPMPKGLTYGWGGKAKNIAKGIGKYGVKPTAALGSSIIGWAVLEDDLKKVFSDDAAKRREGVIDTVGHSVLGNVIKNAEITDLLKTGKIKPPAGVSMTQHVRNLRRPDVITRAVRNPVKFAGSSAQSVSGGLKGIKQSGKAVTGALDNIAFPKAVSRGAGVLTSGAHGVGKLGKNLLVGGLKTGATIAKGAAADAVGSAAGLAGLHLLDKTGALTLLPGVSAEESKQYTDDFTQEVIEGMGLYGAIDATAGAIGNLREQNIEGGRQHDFGDAFHEEAASDATYAMEQFGSEGLIDESGDITWEGFTEAPIQNTAAIVGGSVVGAGSGIVHGISDFAKWVSPW